MRPLTVLLFICISIGCSTTKIVNVKSNILNSTWVPVKQEIGGSILPNTAFENQRLIIHDTAYTFIAESNDKGVIRYSKDKMDIYGREGVNA
jgi:hypothetical protein